MSVLVVDDSSVMRSVQRRVVANVCSVRVHEASDGLDALHRLRDLDFRVDLILTDWSMPHMDGLDLVRTLKAHEQLKKIPVLMVTSDFEEHRMRQALSAGIDGYLLKPFTEEMFFRALCTLSPEVAVQEGANTQLAVADANRGSLLDLLLTASRQELLARADIIDVERGVPVLEAGDRVRAFYLVLDGGVGRVEFEAGSSVERYGAGECFAVTELMARDVSVVDYVATEASQVVRIDAAYFDSLLEASPELSTRVTRLVAERTRDRAVVPDNDPSLAGSLDVLELADLVQALNLRQRSGTIELPECDATIDISGGEVYAVQCEGQVGPDAFRTLLEREPTVFRFVPGPFEGERNVVQSTTSLLMDTIRAIDESNEANETADAVA